MAKFGLFVGAGKEPIQTFDGDYMRTEKDNVRILNHPKGSSVMPTEVVSHKLDKGQFVKKISD